MIDHTGQLVGWPCDVVAVGGGVEAPDHLAAKFHTVGRILHLEDGVFPAAGNTDVNEFDVVTEGGAEMLDRGGRLRET